MPAHGAPASVYPCDLSSLTLELTSSISLSNTCAALAALAIITAFVQEVNKGSEIPIKLLLTDTNVLVGLFIGGMIPFLVASLTITAVGDAAFEMITEIRRQFKEIPGLLEGTG